MLVLGVVAGAGLLGCELAKSGLSSDPPAVTSSVDAGGSEQNTTTEIPDATIDEGVANGGDGDGDATGALDEGQTTDGSAGLGALAPADTGAVLHPIDA